MDFTCGTAGPSRMPMQAFARLLKADVCPQAATLPSDIRWCHMQWHLYETICFFVIFNYIRCRPRSAANIPAQMKCILARHEKSCTYSYRTDLIISIIKLKSFWTGLFMLSSVLILPLIIQVDWIRIHWPNSELIKKKNISVSLWQQKLFKLISNPAQWRWVGLENHLSRNLAFAQQLLSTCFGFWGFFLSNTLFEESCV